MPGHTQHLCRLGDVQAKGLQTILPDAETGGCDGFFMVMVSSLSLVIVDQVYVVHVVRFKAEGDPPIAGDCKCSKTPAAHPSEGATCIPANQDRLGLLATSRSAKAKVIRPVDRDSVYWGHLARRSVLQVPGFQWGLGFGHCAATSCRHARRRSCKAWARCGSAAARLCSSAGSWVRLYSSRRPSS